MFTEIDICLNFHVHVINDGDLDKSYDFNWAKQPAKTPIN